MLTRSFSVCISIAALATLSFAQGGGRGNQQPVAPAGPWMDKTLPPDQRADMVLAQMTIDEKIQLVHGGQAGRGAPSPSNGGAGWIPGIARLGIPDINMADSAVGVTRGAATSRYSTLLPSTLGLAASWDPKAGHLYGAVIGRELRDQGYNMSIGGGVDITREPRNGRNFEYCGEDPILAGKMVGQLMKGVQDQQIMGDIKHYALNDQETGRNIGNAIIDKRSMRESDLLAFEIGLKDSNAAGVMCSYNKVNGDWACENDYLLNQVLKKTFGFQGWVMSDWGGTHSTYKSAMAGLDQEMPGSGFFGEALKKSVESGEIPVARLNDMVHRILRSMFAVGVVDNPPRRQVVDIFKGLEDAQSLAEESIVLLKNSGDLLPLSSAVRSIAVIGSHADVGIISGGGSAQVDPPGGNAAPPPPAPAGEQGGRGGRGGGMFGRGPVYFPDSPLKAIHARAPNAKVSFDAGTDPAAAASLAKSSDIAIVFVNQPMSEGRDAATLSLPDKQDDLVAAVAAANPKTIVVLETGGPVTMPWVDKVSGVLAAFFPGTRGAEAVANILFGEVNPSAKLPVTFAKSEQDLPHPQIAGMNLTAPPPAAPMTVPGGASSGGAPGAPAPGVPGAVGAIPTGGPGGFGGGRGGMPPFDVPYTEGVKVGYKWFDAENKEPLFPFGFGLSYTTYVYSALKVTPAGDGLTVSFSVKNTGKRAGQEIAQVYTSMPASAGEPPKRLIGWDRVELAPGESKTVTVNVEPLYLSIFNEQKDGWQVVGGDYKVMVGGSSKTLPLNGAVKLAGN